MGNRTTFFTIDRRLLEEELWTAEPFTKGQAWVDLIGRASYKDGELTKRGELITSERALADRWHWSRKKVRCFIQSLERAGMIKRTVQGPKEGPSQGPSEGTSLFLEKYAFFQGAGPREGPKKGTREGPYYNNINNINNLSIMPDDIAEELRPIFGDKTEQLLEDVRAYYEQHPEKEFPGWREAALQFNRNQQRWQHRKRQDPMANAIAAFLAEGEEE